MLETRIFDDALFEKFSGDLIVAVSAPPGVQVKRPMAKIRNRDQMAVLEL